VFAHLYSHPDQRSAIEVREPRVLGAVAARDLTDHAPEMLGAENQEWRDRRHLRLGGRGYWVGRPERICFAWSEPELTFWNEITGKEEEGWRLGPPGACLKNRRIDDHPAHRVQIQPPGVGSLQVADRTFYGQLDEDIIIASLDTKRAVRLTGPAADIWKEVVRHGLIEPAVDALATAYDADPERLRLDVNKLVAGFCHRGLLVDHRSEEHVAG
jgi:hypothetical protein